MRSAVAALLSCLPLLGAGCVSTRVSSRPATAFDFNPRGRGSARSIPVAPLNRATNRVARAFAPDVPSQTFTNRNTVITLINPVRGRVASVNGPLRFVVVEVWFNRLPTIGERLGVYRQGMKVGELRVSGPELDANVVADIVAGEAQAGDEVQSE